MFQVPTKRPPLEKLSDYSWEISKDYKKDEPKMQVPARIFASKKLLDEMDLAVYEQISNVAALPGIVKAAMVMPDAHWGYGFPIGGVAAFDLDKGVVSPGGIGYDINCGMRLIKTDFTLKEIEPKLKQLVDSLFRLVPAGVGRKGFVRISGKDWKDVAQDGAQWCIKKGYGFDKDKEHI
ncbi:MAG: RtcB family protein, partial [Nanoarchaeota archaeon]